MNREVLEYNNNNCAVMSDDGMVRVLERDNDNIEFTELLELENELEAYMNSKEDKERKIAKLTGWNAIKNEIYFCIALTGISALTGSLGAILVTKFLEVSQLLLVLSSGAVCGLIGLVVAGSDFIKDRIIDLSLRKDYISELESDNSKINSLKERIEKVKESIKVKDTIVKPIIHPYYMKNYVNIINDNVETRKAVELRNYRLLRSYLNDYLKDDKLSEDKGKQYTINRKYYQ